MIKFYKAAPKYIQENNSIIKFKLNSFLIMKAFYNTIEFSEETKFGIGREMIKNSKYLGLYVFI